MIAQKPGLQYDEALLVAGGVHMAHSGSPFPLDNTPDAWVCPFGHCIPLMAFLYVGSIKEYGNLPFFAAFGPNASAIRIMALVFGAVPIWGIYRLIEPWFGAGTAAAFAFALGINPAFLNMLVFDNGANGGLMAGLGLTCACLAFYALRPSKLSAFWLGAAMGFGVWGRANFSWVIIAGAAAGVLVLRKRAVIPVRHFAAVVTGGIAGGFPFLLYQVVSNGATWRAQRQFTISQPWSVLLRQRLFYFADTLLSDGEHRRMWAGPSLLASWQMWLFPSLVVLGCLICLLWSGRESTPRRSLAQFLTLTFLFAGAFLFLSRLPVAEHHLILLVPFAIALVVLAGSFAQARGAPIKWVSIAVFAIYAASCFYWQFRTDQGLRNTGGVDVWSNSGLELAHYLDQGFSGREIKILDWGLEFNLYVLTDGRIRPRELFSQTSEEVSESGRPWIDEIREGGVFLLHGPNDTEFPKSSAGFLRAVAAERPKIVRSHRVKQQNGTTYAQIIELAPNSFGAGAADNGGLSQVALPMSDTRLDQQLTGFYQPEAGGGRWTRREFSARLDLTDLAHPEASDFELIVHFYVPENVVQRLGAPALRIRFGGHSLSPERLDHAGPYVLRRELDEAWIGRQETRVEFSLDRALAGSGSDGRELGIVVNDILVKPR